MIFCKIIIWGKKVERQLKSKPKLQNVTISVPEIYIENLAKLQDIGLINSRSDGIRISIREFLEKEIEHIDLFGYTLKEVKDNE